MRVIVCVFIAFLFSFSAGAAELCDARATYINEQLENSFSLNTLTQKIAQENPQVIIWGEDHHSPTQAQLPALLEAFKKQMPEIDCVFMEFSESRHTDFERLIKGQQLEEWNPILPYGPYVKKAHELGLRILNVDNASIEEGRGAFKIEMNLRDAVMSTEIAETFKRKVCHQGIFLVGKTHISDGYYKREKTVDKHLHARRIKLTTVNLHDSQVYSKQPKCPQHLPAVHKPYAFQPAPTRLSYSQMVGEWNAFDYFLVLQP